MPVRRAILAACTFVLASSAGARPRPQLTARILDAHTIAIRGRGFAPGPRLRVRVDTTTPHASIACNAAFSRVVPGGRFAVTLAVDPRSDCGFACDRDRTPWVVSVEPADGGDVLVESAPLPCVRR